MVVANSFVLSNDRQDSLSWRWNSSGRFSVHSATDFLTFDGITNCNLPFLWKLKISLRVKLFLWLAERNKILTADNLVKRGWHGPIICVLCNTDAESLEHIMHHCSYTTSLWYWLMGRLTITLAWRSTAPEGLATHWCRLRRMESGQDRTILDLGIAAAYYWEIWKERNRRIFDNRQSGTMLWVEVFSKL
uniref:Reverse transcriptase zinc-binding domain-containing protein n=1 Tax=Ananas comosus var. bracteatus TaxID=296719 RepID=A0A6V7PG13_ANACO|nr:unnamed protein product [Ananas comosus var. bracteatus]